MSKLILLFCRWWGTHNKKSDTQRNQCSYKGENLFFDRYLFDAFWYINLMKMVAIVYFLELVYPHSFALPFYADSTKSSLSLSRYCTASRCQRNWNEVYRISALHVWYCWYIWFHCWSGIHWMVGLPIWILIYFTYWLLYMFYLPYYHFCFLIGQDTSLLLGKDTIHFKEEHTTNF